MARVFEEAGLSTVMVTNAPFFAQIGLPRVVAVEVPYGHMLGYPNDREMQMKLVEAALTLLEDAEGADAMTEVEIEWPQEFDVARKDWHPLELPPIVKMLVDQAKKASEERRG